MTVTQTWKRNSRIPGMKLQVFKYTYGNGDTSIPVATDLKIIYGVNHSTPSVATKTVTGCAVSGSTITLTVTDPLATCYVFITAWGLPK